MATQRLPIPGSDNGSWGSILNGFLEVSHNQDGTLVPSALVTAGAVTSVNNTTPTSGNVTLTANSLGAAPLASPAFTGTPTAPTASANTNTTQLATTAFTTAAVGALSGTYVPQGTGTGATGDVAFGSGRPWFDPVALGADPTGVNNSTTAIQSCINTANSLGGGVVRLPWGTFKANLTMKQHVFLEGSGEVATTLKPWTTGPTITTNGQYFSTGGISKMTIGGNLSDPTNDGIYLAPGLATPGCVLNGTTTVTNSAGFGAVAAGWTVQGSDIAANTTVSSVSGTTLTLSQVATGSGTFTLDFTNSISGSYNCEFRDLLIQNCGRYGFNIEGGSIYTAFHQFNLFDHIQCQLNVSDGWYMTGAVQNNVFNHCVGITNGGNNMTHAVKVDGSGNISAVGQNSFFHLHVEGSGSTVNSVPVTTTTYGLYSAGCFNTYYDPYVEGNGLGDTSKGSCGMCFYWIYSAGSGNEIIKGHFDTHFNDIYFQAGTHNRLKDCDFSYSGAVSATVTNCVLNGTTTVTVASGGFPGVAAGQYVYCSSGGNIQFPTTVVSVVGNTLTLSQAAETSNTVTLEFFANAILGGNAKFSFIEIGGGVSPFIENPTFSGSPQNGNIHVISGGTLPVVLYESSGILGIGSGSDGGPNALVTGSLVTWGGHQGWWTDNTYDIGITSHRPRDLYAGRNLQLAGVPQTYGTAAPGSGTYIVGSIVWNSNPVAGGAVGWICTTAGTPGTWTAFGATSSGVSETGFFIASRWYPQSYTTGTPILTTANDATTTPFVVGASHTFSAIGATITAAGSGGTPTLRFALYADNGSTYPGALIQDFGTVAATSTGAITISGSNTLAPGLYWLVVCPQGATTQPTLATPSTSWPGPLYGLMGSAGAGGGSTAAGYSLTGITGAMPNPFTAGATVAAVANTPLIQLEA